MNMKTKKPQNVQRLEFKLMNSFSFLKTKQTNKKERKTSNKRSDFFKNFAKNQELKDIFKTRARKYSLQALLGHVRMKMAAWSFLAPLSLLGQ